MRGFSLGGPCGPLRMSRRTLPCIRRMQLTGFPGIRGPLPVRQSHSLPSEPALGTQHADAAVSPAVPEGVAAAVELPFSVALPFAVQGRRGVGEGFCDVYHG